MIIEFAVTNFRSIYDEQFLSFVASPDKAHEKTHCLANKWPCAPKLLKSAVLLGPNASGKSNLLAAIRTLRQLIVGAAIGGDELYAAQYTPFDSQSDHSEPTTFKIDLVLDRTRYRYHLSYNAERIHYEELRVYLNHKAQRWFSRRFDAAQQVEYWEAFSAGMHGPREAWRKATGPRALYLTTAARLNSDQLAPLMQWFEKQLDVTLCSNIPDSKAFAQHLGSSNFRARATEVLRAADFAITDIRVKEETVAPRRSSGAGIELLCDRRGLPSKWVAADEYSSGAKRLVHLLVPILDGLENDRFVVIDDFDTYLHPLISKFLFRIINNPSETGRRTQGLLVSHTTALMDLDLLRRDQLWLMQMDENNVSRLQPLKAFSPRRHEGVARGYMEGRYGALPQVDHLAHSLQPKTL